MKISLLTVFSLLCCIGLGTTLHARKAIIHNETTYPMTVDWHTTGFCRFKPNISIPANKTTEIEWTLPCRSTESIWDATIGINPSRGVVRLNDETYYPKGKRIWHITSETPQSRVVDPNDPRRFFDVQKAVRFTVRVDPEFPYSGGVYKGEWFDALTGAKLTKEKIAEYQLPK